MFMLQDAREFSFFLVDPEMVGESEMAGRRTDAVLRAGSDKKEALQILGAPQIH